MSRPVVVYGVLNWGLGHAARSVPIIKALSQHYTVVVHAAGEAMELLQRELSSEILYDSGKDCPIRYYPSFPAWLSVIAQGWKLYGLYNYNHMQVQRLVDKYVPVAVIADSLYGFYDSRVKSILISHQLHSPCNPLMSGCLSYFSKFFSEIWIPDTASPTYQLSGDLSKHSSYSIPVRRIGHWSRFYYNPSSEKYDYLIVLSGPEPARTYFLKEIMKEMVLQEKKIIIVGQVKYLSSIPDNCEYRPLVSSGELQDLLNAAKVIISRCGYSTLMDLIAIKKRAWLFPMKGQPEQQYLAEYLLATKRAEKINTLRNMKGIALKEPLATDMLNEERLITLP